MTKNGFSFNMPDGTNFGHAKNLKEFKKMLKLAPKESVNFHFKRGDFINWLSYLGQKTKAAKIKAIKSTSKLKESIIKALSSKVAKKKKK